MARTDPIERALKLRKTLKQGDKVLVVDFSGTLQGKDTSRVIDLMPNVATGEYVFRAKVNVKGIDPMAAVEYKKEFFDIRTKTDKEIEDYIKRQGFDFPLWFKNDKGFAHQRALDYNPPFIVQVGGCNFHDGSEKGGCWYCFVDDTSNDGLPGGKTLLGPSEHVESMLSARERIREAYLPHGFDVGIKVLRMSGGEPTLVLDYVLDVWREVGRRGLDFVGQIDSNLSTGTIVDAFEKEGIFEPNTLEKLAQFPVKVLTAIKGPDDANIEENVQSGATIETQKHSIKKFLRAGFQIFPQVYNPNPGALVKYMEMMDSEIENFSLRVHIGPLSLYGPTKKRLTHEARAKGLDPQAFIDSRKKQWDDNYSASCERLDTYLRQRYGTGYKENVRSDIPLRLLG